MSDHSPRLPTFVEEAFLAGTLAAMQELYQLEGRAEAPGSRRQASGPPESESHSAEPLVFDGQVAIVAQVELLREPAGTLTMVVPVDVASRLAQRYLPEGSELSDDLVDDCIGELANVVAGQGKTALKGTPYHFMLTTPVVTRHTALPVDPGNVWCCLITSEAGTLAIVVCLP